MPYLNLDLDFFEHPKTRRLVGLLGKGSEVVPIKVWAYAGKYHAKDGKLTDYSAQEIESIVGWWGASGKMVEALVKCGFLHEVKGGWQVHDWLEHEGHIIAFKERAKTAAYARWGVDATSNATSNAPTIPTIPAKPANKKLFVKGSHELRLSEILLELILARSPGFKKPDIQAWAKEMDFILRVDKRLPDEIEKVIRWCQADDFWQNNILSPAKLRKQYDQLILKMGKGASNGSNQKHSQATRTQAGGIRGDSSTYDRKIIRFDEGE